MLSENIRNLRKAKGISQEELAKRSEMRTKIVRYLLASLAVMIVIVFIILAIMHSAYLEWNFSNLELAIAGTMLHGFEFLFVRIAPFVFIASIIGIIFTYKKR